MEIYHFNAYENGLCTTTSTLSEAMKSANNELIWHNPKSKEGAWFQEGTSNNWNWVEGNYFD